MERTRIVGFAALLLGLVACGDDTSGGGGTGGSSDDGGGETGGSTDGGAGTGGDGTGGDGGTTDGGGGEGGGSAQTEAIAIVRGELFTDDMEEAQASHDPIAQGGEQPSKDAGDIHHEVFLGTTIMGTTQNEFVAFDRWSSDENMDAFYSNPDFQAALGSLFANPPPELDTFLRSDFYGWGDLDAGDAVEPHYIVVVLGRLADDPEVIQAQHDAVAMGGEEQAAAAGDVAHITHLGREDPREVLIIELWKDEPNIEAFYTNPDFSAAFPPALRRIPERGASYPRTDWVPKWGLPLGKPPRFTKWGGGSHGPTLGFQNLSFRVYKTRTPFEASRGGFVLGVFFGGQNLEK